MAEIVLNVRSTHSERLLPAVERILADAGCSLDRVQGIAAALGPGSFTGLRIGLSAAKSFAYAKGLPLAGVTVFEALARQFQCAGTVICPLLDARREEVYAQAFLDNAVCGGPWNCSLQWLIRWAAAVEKPVLFCGGGAVVHADVLRSGVPRAILPPLEQRLLRSASVAGLGRERLLAGQTISIMDAVPFYMRKSEAELKWDAKTKL